MKILVILGHPQRGSFNHAIAATAVSTLENDGHEVSYHDLQAEGFDPILPGQEVARDGLIDSVVSTHCNQLVATDGVVIVHPNWWGQPPAVLKGWIDRVFRPGVAYEFEEGDSGEGVPVGLLRVGAAVVFNTSNTPEARELSVFGDPLENLWKTCIFDLCGVRDFHRRNFGVIVTSTPEQRAKWLQEVGEVLRKVFPRESSPS